MILVKKYKEKKFLGEATCYEIIGDHKEFWRIYEFAEEDKKKAMKNKIAENILKALEL